jgi:type VI secretion system protein ImpJ
MSSAHDLPEAIQWHEGMLLGPQHFQQQALRFERLFHYHVSLLAPYCWGVRHLKIDPVLLVEGQFRVLELEAVMPDGLVVTSVLHEIKDGTINLEAYRQEASEAPVAIHLAVPARRGTGAQMQGELRRYDSVEGSVVTDENTGETELRIPRLRPRLSLLVGPTPPEKFVSMPLARVVYQDEAFSLDRYSPPRLQVPATSGIGELCSTLATRLREKAVLLAEKARTPSVSARAPQLVETRSQVRAIVTCLPEFEALVGTGVTHPFMLYLGLTRLLGSLTSLGASLLPPALEPYDHNDPFRSFSQAVGAVDRIIAEGFIESFSAYPLAFDEGRFSVRFDPDWADRRIIIGVRSKPGATTSDAASWIEDSIIGSESKVPSMRLRRVLGAERKKIEGEDDLVPTSGVNLYVIEADPESIVAEEPLLIFNPHDPVGDEGPADIVLYVRNPKKA